MYAERYARSGGINPGSLGIAVGINAAMLAALMLANPNVATVFHDPPTTIFDVPIDPPPDPIPPEHKADPKVQPRDTVIETTDPLVKTPPTDMNPDFPPQPPQPPADPAAAEGGGTGTVAVEPVRPPLPVLVQPGIDPRYANLFQPPYPPAEQRAGHTGRVVVRVLIGVDGRVKQVQRVLAASDDFFRVTEQRALSKWRFTPATRDGIPVEGWKAMTVTFVLDDDR